MEIQAQPENQPLEQDATMRLSQVAAESKLAIENSKPEKKKRGPYKKKDGENSGQSKRPQASPENSQSVQGAQAQVVDAVPIISIALQAISQLPAAKLKCPALALSDEEAKTNAQAVDTLLKAYVPDVQTMNPKTAAWIGLSTVAGVTLISKLMVYSEFVASNETKPQVANDNEILNPPVQNSDQSIFPFQRQ